MANQSNFDKVDVWISLEGEGFVGCFIGDRDVVTCYHNLKIFHDDDLGELDKNFGLYIGKSCSVKFSNAESIDAIIAWMNPRADVMGIELKANSPSSKPRRILDDIGEHLSDKELTARKRDQKDHNVSHVTIIDRGLAVDSYGRQWIQKDFITDNPSLIEHGWSGTGVFYTTEARKDALVGMITHKEDRSKSKFGRYLPIYAIKGLKRNSSSLGSTPTNSFSSDPFFDDHKFATDSIAVSTPILKALEVRKSVYKDRKGKSATATIAVPHFDDYIYLLLDGDDANRLRDLSIGENVRLALKLLNGKVVKANCEFRSLSVVPGINAFFMSVEGVKD